MKALDWVILALIALAVCLAIRFIRARRKQGRPMGCSGNCAGCPGCAAKKAEGDGGKKR